MGKEHTKPRTPSCFAVLGALSLQYCEDFGNLNFNDLIRSYMIAMLLLFGPSFGGLGLQSSSHCSRFMHQNGFQSVSHLDDACWPPLCYACVNGNSAAKASGRGKEVE